MRKFTNKQSRKGKAGIRVQARRRCLGNTGRKKGGPEDTELRKPRNEPCKETMATHTCPNTRWWLSRPGTGGEEMTFSPPDMAVSHNDSREWEAGPAGGRECRHWLGRLGCERVDKQKEGRSSTGQLSLALEEKILSDGRKENAFAGEGREASRSKMITGG